MEGASSYGRGCISHLQYTSDGVSTSVLNQQGAPQLAAEEVSPVPFPYHPEKLSTSTLDADATATAGDGSELTELKRELSDLIAALDYSNLNAGDSSRIELLKAIRSLELKEEENSSLKKENSQMRLGLEGKDEVIKGMEEVILFIYLFMK